MSIAVIHWAQHMTRSHFDAWRRSATAAPQFPFEPGVTLKVRLFLGVVLVRHEGKGQSSTADVKGN